MNAKGEEYAQISMEQFGLRLKSICDERKITPKDLQEMLHLGSVQAVYMWFEGKRLPRVDNMYALCRHLNVSMEVLLGKEE